MVSEQPNVGGAVVGALIGGVIGHQIGAGSGRDLATAGGAVAGAVIGSNVDNGPEYSVNKVQRCAAGRERERPQYWDVVYIFRGTEHHMQTMQPPAPGSMITVNEHGEPRTS